MYEMIRTVAESVAIGTALVLASLDLSGAQAQTLSQGMARPAAMPAVIYPTTGPQRSQVSVQRGRDGHFRFETSVNGATIPMMFDTGATFVALRAEDAEAAGLDTSALRYSVTTRTANGTATMAPVTLSTVSVGGIARHNVPAFVSRPGVLSISLLGQSFMAGLAGYRQEGDMLILRGVE